MLLPAADLVGLVCAQLQEVPRALGLADQVERLAVVLEDGPVGVVLADGRVDLEPAGQLDEELDVLALVELAGRTPAPLRSRRRRTRRPTCSPAGRSGS